MKSARMSRSPLPSPFSSPPPSRRPCSFSHPAASHLAFIHPRITLTRREGGAGSGRPGPVVAWRFRSPSLSPFIQAPSPCTVSTFNRLKMLSD